MNTLKYISFFILYLNCLLFYSCGNSGEFSNVVSDTTNSSIQIDTVVEQISPRKKYADFIYPHASLTSWESVRDSVEVLYLNDSLGLREMYNSARWYSYCIYCFDTFYFTPYAVAEHGVPPHIPAIEENLELVQIGISNINFKHKNKTILANYIFCFGPQTTGYKTDSIYATYKNDSKYYQNHLFLAIYYSIEFPEIPLAFGPRNTIIQLYPTANCPFPWARKVLANPFQPEIIKHVRENANRLNPWFLAEAKKRGMFDSAKYSPTWVEKQIAANKKKHKDCY